jgi:hypothetical protein
MLGLLLWGAAAIAVGQQGARDHSAYGYSQRGFHSSRCSSCARDSYGHIRRNPAMRREFRRNHPCPSTGKTSGSCPGYVIDHVQALKHGGADAPSNMQWQTTADAKAKDKWE